MCWEFLILLEFVLREGEWENLGDEGGGGGSGRRRSIRGGLSLGSSGKSTLTLFAHFQHFPLAGAVPGLVCLLKDTDILVLQPVRINRAC